MLPGGPLLGPASVQWLVFFELPRMLLHEGHDGHEAVGGDVSFGALFAIVVGTLLVVGALWYLRFFERLAALGER